MDVDTKEPLLMDIKALMTLVHIIALQHNWWERPRTFGDLMMLITSKASEAFEIFRATPLDTETRIWANPDPATVFEGVAKPEGIPIKLADVIIQALDIAAHYNIDIVEALKVKIGYNKVRPIWHRGKHV